jgi:hypothetical protein
MDSTVKPDQAGTRDVQLARGDETPKRDYEDVVREELARVQERLAKLAPVNAPAASEVRAAPDALGANITSFRAPAASAVGAPEQQLPPKRGAARLLTALLVVAGIVGAGAAWAAYGDAARPWIASWAPQIGVAVSQVSEKLGLTSATASPPPVQTAAADSTAPQGSVPVQAATQDTSPAATTAPPDVTQLLQGMARDIAMLQQGIEQLKASQEQITRDNAKLAEQLRASQEQMTRMTARTSEQALHPKLPPRPVVAAVRKPVSSPVSTLPPPQAIAPPPQATAPQAQTPADDMEIPGVGRPPRSVPQ